MCVCVCVCVCVCEVYSSIRFFQALVYVCMRVCVCVCGGGGGLNKQKTKKILSVVLPVGFLDPPTHPAPVL